MAINVDDVYKTVLYVLNKEQRGYLTPEEFNKIATQVQLEIFEKYFEDLNQYSRIQDNDTEYGNRIDNIEEKLDIFKTNGDCAWNVNEYYEEPDLGTYSASGLSIEFYKLGTVIYNNTEVQRAKPNELLYINKSPLTKPTITYPVYTYENHRIYVYPKTIVGTMATQTALATTPISATCIRKPQNVKWGYIPGTLGQFEYNATEWDGAVGAAGSTNFELHASEQSEVVLNVLMYAGVVIRDPQIVQIASQKAQQDEVSEKS
ncbi:MAG TPA: hypothetical protein QF753_23035 [Victivallales bacterium]|nr:hypothetical protein [Victivallales bacterium]